MSGITVASSETIGGEALRGRLDLALVFAAVAEAGSFTRAAERMGSSKAQVSKQVAELERALGAQLILRTTRRLTLTESGLVYLDYARTLRETVLEAERAVSALRHEVAGRIRLTAPTSFGDTFLTDLLLAFCQKYPAVEIDLDLSIGRRDLVADGYDLALRNARSVEEHLVARPLGIVRELPLAAPSLLARTGAIDRPDQLAAHAAIVNSHFGDDVHWLFESTDGVEAVRVRSSFRVNSYSAIKRAALAGAGIARLPRYLVGTELASGTLQRICANHDLVATPLWLVQPYRRQQPLRNRVFAEFVLAWFEEPARRALFA